MEKHWNKILFDNQNLTLLKNIWLTDKTKHLYIINFKKDNKWKVNNKIYDMAIVDLVTAKTYWIILNKKDIKNIDVLDLYCFDPKYYNEFNHDNIYYVGFKTHQEQDNETNKKETKKLTPDELNAKLWLQKTLF